MAYVGIIVIFILINFMMQCLAEYTDKMLFLENIKDSVTVSGEIIGIDKSSLLENRMAHYSGFHFSIVEYAYQGNMFTKNVMRLKGDYIGRKIDLAIGQGYVVRKEHEKPYAFPWHVFLLGTIPFLLIYNSKWMDKGILLICLSSVVVILLFYAYRKHIIMHIYFHREIEWRNKQKIQIELINEEKLSKIVTWGFIGFLIAFIFMMIFFSI